MLKIKDNVDLKELEKFGIKKVKYGGYEKIICEGRRGQAFYLVIYNDRLIQGYADGADGSGCDSPIDDTLYDLIKADLVEKVESEE